MGWEYIDSDRDLRLSMAMKLSGGAPGCGEGGAGNGFILFQFPPKIISDSRKGNWSEAELRGTEPVAAFSTSGAREITIQTTYVVDSHDISNADAWTIPRITRQIRTLRGYFALVRDAGSARENLAVQATLWCVLPQADGQIPSGRLKSIDVKYGETMVYPPDNPVDAFPLRSDVTMEFRLWTKNIGRGENTVVHDINNLRDRELPQWY